MHQSVADDFSGKLIALWTAFLLGLLFHTQLALIPLFHGLSVAESHTHEMIGLEPVMWFMLIFFSLPLLAMIGCVFYASWRFRKLHFVMTLVYSIFNLLHLVLDSLIAVPRYQLVLMAMLFCVGLLLNLVAYQWVKIARRAERQSNRLM